MPSAHSPDVVHVAITDHRILPHTSQPDRAPQPAASRAAVGHMVVFHRDLMDEHERAEAERDVGVGLALRNEGPDSTAAALPLLEAALLGRPDDVTAWEAKGIVLGRLGPRRGLGCPPDGPGPGTEPGIDPDARGVPGHVCGATRGRHCLLATRHRH